MVIEAQARDGQPEREAKLAILLASMLAAALGIAILLATAGPAEPGPVALDH